MLLGQSSPRFSEIPIGSSIEVSPTSFRTARQVGELLLGNGKNQEGESSRSPGGCGLIIDYGDDHVFGDSFRVSRMSTKVNLHFLPRLRRHLATTSSSTCLISPVIVISPQTLISPISEKPLKI